MLAVDSSDEEADDADDEEVDSSDDEAASDGEESGESDEDEEEEETYDVLAIHDKKGKGKTLKYLVEWEGWEEKTWEPAALLTNNIVLKAWLANRAEL